MANINRVEKISSMGSKPIGEPPSRKKNDKLKQAEKALQDYLEVQERLPTHIHIVKNNIHSIKKHLRKKEALDTANAKIVKQLEELNKGCDNVDIRIRKLQKGEKDDLLLGEFDKIKKIINNLHMDPEMQKKVAQVNVFWQVIDAFIDYIDAFERASIQPKRVRVERVSNERLDTK